MENNFKLDRLKCTFPKLTETNQYYILGIAAGLKYVQKKYSGNAEKEKQKKQSV